MTFQRSPNDEKHIIGAILLGALTVQAAFIIIAQPANAYSTDQINWLTPNGVAGAAQWDNFVKKACEKTGTQGLASVLESTREHTMRILPGSRHADVRIYLIQSQSHQPLHLYPCSLIR